MCRYTEIVLGPEWLPGLLDDEGAAVRAELGKMTGQTSMPPGFSSSATALVFVAANNGEYPLVI